MSELPDMFGYTVFCDDIRREDSGKLTFVGSYFSAMYTHSDFPLPLPKFGIAITYFERIGKFTGNVDFSISFPTDSPEGSVLSVTVPLQELREQPPEESPDRDKWPKGEFHRLDHQLLLSPLIIQKAGVIKVRAQCDGEVAKIGILRIGRSKRAVATDEGQDAS